jgi:hypothetical protein
MSSLSARNLEAICDLEFADFLLYNLPGTPVTHDRSQTYEIVTMCWGPTTGRNCSPPRILGDNPGSI